jgi:hypothetical protein
MPLRTLSFLSFPVAVTYSSIHPFLIHIQTTLPTLSTFESSIYVINLSHFSKFLRSPTLKHGKHDKHPVISSRLPRSSGDKFSLHLFGDQDNFQSPSNNLKPRSVGDSLNLRASWRILSPRSTRFVRTAAPPTPRSEWHTSTTPMLEIMPTSLVIL